MDMYFSGLFLKKKKKNDLIINCLPKKYDIYV